MNTTITLPVGEAILGRVLNANGEPVDNKGNLEHVTRVPISIPEIPGKTSGRPARLLETGIKTIDLLAPVACGSVVGFIAGYGLGKEVVAEELMHQFLKDRQSIAVIAGMRETAYDASGLREMVREIEVEDRTVMLFEQSTEDGTVRQRLFHAAMTIAAHLSDNGRAVFLMIDSQVIMKADLADLRRFANARGITTFVFIPVNDLHQPTERALLDELDVQLWFSQERARQSLWPAVDPLASTSLLLASELVAPEHQHVARRVREVLKRYYDLREHVNGTTPGEEERQILAGGERIDLFFTQPFVVAEAFTDVPGTYLTREQTIKSFRDLLDGRYDETPTQAFRFVGQIEV